MSGNFVDKEQLYLFALSDTINSISSRDDVEVIEYSRDVQSIFSFAYRRNGFLYFVYLKAAIYPKTPMLTEFERARLISFAISNDGNPMFCPVICSSCNDTNREHGVISFNDEVETNDGQIEYIDIEDEDYTIPERKYFNNLLHFAKSIWSNDIEEIDELRDHVINTPSVCVFRKENSMIAKTGTLNEIVMNYWAYVNHSFSVISVCRINGNQALSFETDGGSKIHSIVSDNKPALVVRYDRAGKTFNDVIECLFSENGVLHIKITPLECIDVIFR